MTDGEMEAQLRAIAAKLQAVRFERGLRLIDVANISGISEAHLYRLEQGERIASLRVLLSLASAYGIDAGALLSRDDAELNCIQPHSGRAVWEGSEHSGTGQMIHRDMQVRYDRATRQQPSIELSPLANDQTGTVGSPETLIGMALAGCFAMALAETLDRAGFTAERIEAFTDVRVRTDPSQVSIAEVALTCEASVPTIDAEQFQTLAHLAKRDCLVARALAAVPATLDARLVGREVSAPTAASAST